MTTGIIKALNSGILPDDPAELLRDIKEDADHFISQEGQNWDFKDQWPFSYSDSYFAGIARLVCAFANTTGGIIIFGVDDKTRKAGKNKVLVNVDRLLQSLKQLLTFLPEIIVKSYFKNTDNSIDVMLIRPIDHLSMPVRFCRSIEKYRSGIIWVRDGHEVIEARPRHIAQLYCRAPWDKHGQEPEQVAAGMLPPSSATIRNFVGRLETIDKIFGWLKQSDEPRIFLYGKGGSGKTTIAYQVSKIISNNSNNFVSEGGEIIDYVIFVSAKIKSLNIATGKEEETFETDFTDEASLYASIIRIVNWTDKDTSCFDIHQLKNEIIDLFNTFSLL